jgi:hypothetical protein
MGFYNENGEYENRELETYQVEKICKACGKRYKQIQEEQISGFRDRSYDYCPYCGEENGSSMSWDYYNSKIDEE